MPSAHHFWRQYVGINKPRYGVSLVKGTKKNCFIVQTRLDARTTNILSKANSALPTTGIKMKWWFIPEEMVFVEKTI